MRDTWFCKCCFRQTEIEHDGTYGYCVGCQTAVVNRGDIFHAAWYPLVEFGVSAVSRPAGVALRTLKRAEESASPDWGPALNLAALAIIGIVGGFVLNEVFGGKS